MSYRTIIAGSRTIIDYDIVKNGIKESGFIIDEVVCGLAQGPDILGEKWALEHRIPVTYFPANWRDFGKSAGCIRNEQMGNYADQLILIWDGKSRGSEHMLRYAKHKKLLIYVKNINTSTVLDFI
jgi:hypothetical protein